MLASCFKNMLWNFEEKLHWQRILFDKHVFYVPSYFFVLFFVMAFFLIWTFQNVKFQNYIHLVRNNLLWWNKMHWKVWSPYWCYTNNWIPIPCPNQPGFDHLIQNLFGNRFKMKNVGFKLTIRILRAWQCLCGLLAHTFGIKKWVNGTLDFWDVYLKIDRGRFLKFLVACSSRLLVIG